MSSLNPLLGSKMMSAKMGSMQVLLLTAMTIFGFYLCFKELRRLAIEVTSLNDQVMNFKLPPKEHHSERKIPLTRPAEVPPVIYDNEEEDDEGAELDEGFKEMLSKMQGDIAMVMTGGAMPPPPPPMPAPAEVVEIAEEPEESINLEEEITDVQDDPVVTPDRKKELLSKTKTELTEIMDSKGLSHKKGDNKTTIVNYILEAEDAEALKAFVVGETTN
ncbi:hypothetical protein TetV_262 [Tetraselmis virus 1]|uniref:Uncharacterized protein n=1 Tax=Tetraselmis virus 1 TaxID=2060617 RepID=A0A2P0VN76_9VIRU|nr:hypothetical protein QJ968_gp262 [Tetraselmis virus 1]AUF82354.1 hypothetical protein TetV_262 [Tetraselmis virus 1]